MTDGIGRTPPIRPTTLGPSRAGEIDRNKHEQVHQDSPGKVNDDARHAQQAEELIESLTLSLPILRAIAGETLPAETLAALAGFAPLGDLKGIDYLCDRLEKQGRQHILWPNTLSLRQALENAAS